jgi:hypothetical protein
MGVEAKHTLVDAWRRNPQGLRLEGEVCPYCGKPSLFPRGYYYCCKNGQEIPVQLEMPAPTSLHRQPELVEN